MTFDEEHIAKASSEEIQGILDAQDEAGWRLVSTDAVSFGMAVYVYLYVERDA